MGLKLGKAVRQVVLMANGGVLISLVEPCLLWVTGLFRVAFVIFLSFFDRGSLGLYRQRNDFSDERLKQVVCELRYEITLLRGEKVNSRNLHAIRNLPLVVDILSKVIVKLKGVVIT